MNRPSLDDCHGVAAMGVDVMNRPPLDRLHRTWATMGVTS
jgi:hypothetical protein